MTAVNLNALRAHVELLIWAKQRKAEIKDIEANSRSEIEAAMGDAEIGTLDGEEAIHWTTYKKRQFKQAALRAEHPELAEEYTELVEQRKFEVLDGE